MKRRLVGILLAGIVGASVLAVASEPASSWADGTAGSSGAIPEHMRKCAEGFKYCKVKPSGCGGCHGDWDAMQVQRQTERPVIDRISAIVQVSGDPEKWEYDPGRRYVIDIFVHTNRDPGFWNTASFDLNVSAGRFELFAGDDTLRITGGNYTHAGTKNNTAPYQEYERFATKKYGATTDDESQWAGELTTTGKGANTTRTEEGYHWKAMWIAPAKQEPHGVAFVMAFMVTNSDGVDTCTYVECNLTKGYSDQDNWDWWSFMIPRKILCESGQQRVRCEEKVLSFIIPPAPPPNTGGATDGADQDGFGSPSLPGEALVALLLVGLFVHRRRRRSPPR